MSQVGNICCYNINNDAFNFFENVECVDIVTAMATECGLTSFLHLIKTILATSFLLIATGFSMEPLIKKTCFSNKFEQFASENPLQQTEIRGEQGFR